MANTVITPDAVHKAANEHRDCMQMIQQQQNRLDGQISALEAGSRNSMTSTLNSMYQQWKGEVGQILKDLDDMANDMDAFANQLAGKDEFNATSVRQVLGASTGSFGNYFG